MLLHSNARAARIRTLAILFLMCGRGALSLELTNLLWYPTISVLRRQIRKRAIAIMIRT